MGVPLFIIRFNGMFHYYHPAIGVPPFMETYILSTMKGSS